MTEALIWPDRLRIRDTGLHDDLGGPEQRIYTTAGRGYERQEYVRADLFDALTAEHDALRAARKEDFIRKVGNLIQWLEKDPDNIYLLPADGVETFRKWIHGHQQPQKDTLRVYAREAIIHSINDLAAHLEQHHDSEEETPEARNLRHIMHHLEGTLIGMDDDADISMPHDETAV
ncbi:MAG: hypothetical protein FJX25_02445 [Alphaproteobacteria bacterium]|nr:hypothetical protein [Alphaproteobacteria bacterium]